MGAGPRYVGVDLAWGLRAVTGLAALDASGRLLQVAEARTDEQVAGWLEEWATEPCLVAFDAPLVVRNPTGRRACESLVARYFGRYHAAPHSSNTSMPHFVDGGRAARLATAAGLDTDPTAASGRRAVEVYPHPAIVALFGLDSILRYKDKPGRDVTLRRAELTRLIDLLGSLESADVPLRLADHPGWAAIRAATSAATRKVDLGRVEDRVDAVVCAYVARYADAAPDQVRVLGTHQDGYILTPVTPALAERIDADLRRTPTPSPAGTSRRR